MITHTYHKKIQVLTAPEGWWDV